MFKKDDRSNLKNDRPLSLSYVDYKMLAFALADRLQIVLETLISPDQTAYTKNPFIDENVPQMQATIDYITRFNIPGLILFLTFKKLLTR